MVYIPYNDTRLLYVVQGNHHCERAHGVLKEIRDGKGKEPHTHIYAKETKRKPPQKPRNG